MQRFTPGTMLGIIAIVLAMTGSAVAAGGLITGARIKNNSVTGLDIRNKSLSPADFRGSVQGPPGAPGAPGPAGTVAGTIETLGPQVFMGEGGSGTNVQASKAECPPGTTVVGGGFDTGVRTFIGLQRKSGNGYYVIAINVGSLTTYIQAQAICGVGATPVLTRASSVAARERQALARLRAAAQ